MIEDKGAGGGSWKRKMERGGDGRDGRDEQMKERLERMEIEEMDEWRKG